MKVDKFFMIVFLLLCSSHYLKAQDTLHLGDPRLKTAIKININRECLTKIQVDSTIIPLLTKLYFYYKDSSLIKKVIINVDERGVTIPLERLFGSKTMSKENLVKLQSYFHNVEDCMDLIYLKYYVWNKKNKNLDKKELFLPKMSIKDREQYEPVYKIQTSFQMDYIFLPIQNIIDDLRE